MNAPLSTQTAVEKVARSLASYELRHIRRTLEAELIEAAQAGVRGTHAHAGHLEMLAAVGAELDRRGDLIPSPPYIDLCIEDGVRCPMQVRVF